MTYSTSFHFRKVSSYHRTGQSLHDEVLIHHTDPVCWDTDADGLSDGEEISRNTNPLERDSDGDGLPDGQEVHIGTNPNDWDSDDDRLNDKWEHDRAPFNPLDSTDGLADTDGDGLSNRDEILYPEPTGVRPTRIATESPTVRN